MRTTDRPGPGTRKGQAWVMDFTIGIVVLTLIMLVFIILWNAMAQRWGYIAEQTGEDSIAYFVSESLLATPGVPESWEMLPAIDNNVSAFGLANGRNELNPLKLQRLSEANATSYRMIVDRLGAEGHDFGLRVSDLGGSTVYYAFGKFSAGRPNESLSFDRFALLNGTPVLVHMEVWGE